MLLSVGRRAPDPLLEKLTSEQRTCVDRALQGRNIFITGSGGVGKSLVLRTIIHELTRVGKLVVATASTGIASLLLPQGCTLHSFVGVGLGAEEAGALARRARANPKVVERHAQTHVLVIDEISMCDAEYFEKCSFILQKTRGSSKPFGGIQLIVCGDFFQLPPVMKEHGFFTSAGGTSPSVPRRFDTTVGSANSGGGNSAGSARFCFQTAAWSRCEFFVSILFQIHRQKDSVFVEALEEIREGRVTTKTLNVLRRRIVSKDELLSSGTQKEVTTLFAVKARVAELNKQRLEELVDSGAESRVFRAKFNAEPFSLAQQPSPAYRPPSTVSATAEQKEDSKTKLERDMPAEATLTLAVGALVLLVSNDYREHGVMNGSGGTVESFSPDGYPLVRFHCLLSPGGSSTGLSASASAFAAGDGGSSRQDNELLEIRRSRWERAEPSMSFRMVVEQVPLILGYAITIHKSQGMTLDRMVVDLGRQVFAKGQSYVALSRVRSLEGLYLLDFDPDSVQADPAVVSFYKMLRNHKNSRAGVQPEESAACIDVGDEEGHGSDARGNGVAFSLPAAKRILTPFEQFVLSRDVAPLSKRSKRPNPLLSADS